ncbi:hypothetical protein [Marinactinospora rubrisoli]|uniref:Uncharacterized protein n=1 Tax=Marinactinospora rubrisoli TaxID=2715399 RepID=A0ABW2KNH3_9ACTN
MTLIAPHPECLHATHVARRLLECAEIQPSVHSPGEPIPPGVLPVVVALSTAHAVREAARMVTGWHPEVQRPVLLVVADAPLPAPPIVQHRIHAVRERVAAVLHLPYLLALRAVDDPQDCLTTPRGRPSRAHRHVRRLRGDIIRTHINAMTKTRNPR